jgi:hypothetical protein
MASRSNHAYWYVVGQTDSDADIVVDPNLVEETLAQLDVTA